MALRASPLSVTIAWPGYTLAVWLVRGTTIRRLRARFAPLLLTISAGRVFWISPPTDGSNATHQTSPLRGCIADQPFAPLFCLCLLLGVACHLAIALQQSAGSAHGEFVHFVEDYPFNLNR